MKTFSELLTDQGLDYRKAAEILGVKPNIVWRHEKGERQISSQYARLYHEKLGMPLKPLLGIQDDEATA